MERRLLILVFLGIVSVDDVFGISGGQPFEWNASIPIYNSRNDYICTANIISRIEAVTSASCLGYYPAFKGFVNKDHIMALFVRVTSPDRRIRSRVLLVTDLMKHPSWEHDSADYDVAVIRVTDNFFDTLPYYYVALPEQGEARLTPGVNVQLIGWGAKLENFPNEYLIRTAGSVIMPMQLCKTKYPDEDLDGERFICTFKRGAGACQGDDGGAVLVELPSGSLRLVGIIGYRKGCGYEDYPDVHVNIYSVMSFINTTLSEKFGRNFKYS